jgi:hypothetical protein
MAGSDEKETIPYPTNHVVGIIARTSVEAVLSDLRSQNFTDADVHVQQGTEVADRLAASSGHSGILGAILRIADHLGIREDELEEKHRYEEALRDGDAVVLVYTPEEDRKDRAGKILNAHGAHFINFLGRYTSERIKP